MKLHAFKRFRRNAKGATALEFALVFPVFVIITFGIIEFALAFRVHNDLSHAASTAARLVMLDDDISNSTLKSQLRALLARIDGETLSVDVSTTTVDGQDYRLVEISYPYEINTPFFSGVNFTFQLTRTVPQNL